jgi:5-methyltetrahydrofolate--homocysteine methyltransferase
VEILSKLASAIENGDNKEAGKLTSAAIAEKIPAKQILDDGLIAGMTVVGVKFKNHQIFLPDVLLAARAMYAGMELLKPLMIKDEVPTQGKVVIGTVQGDLHDIGKNLVAIMLRGAGYEVIDLGSDVAPERFVSAAQEEQAPVIGLSALLTTTMPAMKRVVELVKEKQLGDKVKVIIGGAPVSQDYADEIGADAYAFDGVSAVDRVKMLAGGN